jgi:hypothetical protein
MFTTLTKMLGAFLFGLVIVFVIAQSFNVPHFVVSSEAIEDDGEFNFQQEWMFVEEAFDNKGFPLTTAQIRELSTTSPRFSVEFRAPKYRTLGYHE